MTLKEVARMANVSVSTASKALNDSFDVSPETRELVMKVAREIGYFREKKKVTSLNRRAERLTVAVITPEVISPYYSAMTESLMAVCADCGCRIVIHSVGFDKDEAFRVAKECADDQKIDAIICFCSVREGLEAGSVPVVITSEKPVPGYSNMYSDLKTAISEIIREYAGKHLAFAGEPLTVSKAELFLSCCKNGNSVIGEGRYELSGKESARKLIASGELPDAVICAYDEVAYGLISELKRSDVTVPDDVEVIGINDIRTSEWFFGGISSIGFMYEDIFRQMISDIIRDIADRRITKREYVIPCRLVKRKTTK